MIETIRYGFGQSSLGDFLLAMSDQGLVAFEFASQGTATLDALRQRLSGAELRRERGIKTARGGEWSAVQVGRILARSET